MSSAVDKIYVWCVQRIMQILNAENLANKAAIVQLINNDINVQVNSANGQQWFRTAIVAPMQNAGRDISQGAPQADLDALCIAYLKRAVPAAVQRLSQAGGGGVIGGVVGGVGAFDYGPSSATTGGGGMIGADTGAAAALDFGTTIQTPPAQTAAPVAPAATPIQPAAAPAAAASPGAQQMPQSVSSVDGLFGSNTSLIREDNLDWITAKAESIGYQSQAEGGGRSLLRAGFYLTPGRPVMAFAQSPKFDTTRSAHLTSCRAFNNPMDVLKLFYANAPAQMLQGIWYYTITYHQFDVLDVPTSQFAALQARVRENYSEDGANLDWRGAINVLQEAPAVVSNSIDRAVTPRLNNYLRRFMRSPIKLSACASIDQISDVLDIMSPEFKSRIVDDPEWVTSLTRGMLRCVMPLFTPDMLISASSLHRRELASCLGISLGSADTTPVDVMCMTDTEGDRLIEEALREKTVLRTQRNVVITNSIPYSHVTSTKRDVNGKRPDEEAVFWILRGQQNPPMEDTLGNEIVFCVPLRHAPHEALAGLEFARPLSSSESELIRTRFNLNQMMWGM